MESGEGPKPPGFFAKVMKALHLGGNAAPEVGTQTPAVGQVTETTPQQPAVQVPNPNSEDPRIQELNRKIGFMDEGIKNAKNMQSNKKPPQPTT